MYNGTYEICFFTGEPESVNNAYGDWGQIYRSWQDFGLVPKSRPVIALPAVKTNVIDIPGGNGSLDLSNVLTGYPLFKNRSGTLEFACQTSNDPEDENYWMKRYQTLMNAIHGKRLKMLLSQDMEEPDPYYYEGSFEVEEWTNDESFSSVTISYDLYPLKKRMIPTIYTVDVNGSASITLEPSDMPAIPCFHVLESLDHPGDGDYVMMQMGSYRQGKTFSWNEKMALKKDGTTVANPSDSYDSTVATYQVTNSIDVNPGDTIVMNGFLSSRHLDWPYCVGYDRDGAVVTCLLAFERDLEGVDTDVLPYSRWLNTTTWTVPEGVYKVRLCFEKNDGMRTPYIDAHYEHYVGDAKMLNVGEKTYFSDITAVQNTTLYFVGRNLTVDISYRRERL